MPNGADSIYTPRAWRKNPGSEVQLPLGVKLKWVISIWLPCLIYAIVRYNIFKGVEWIHLPLYVVNKSFALAGVILIACSYLVGKVIPVYRDDVKCRRALAKFCGLTGFLLIGMHIFMGFLMMSPVYFEKFFHESGMLNLSGEMALLFGVMGVGCLIFPAVTTLPYMCEALGGKRWLRAQRMGYWALAMAAGHTFAMGFQGWLDVGAWPGGLPPITLLGFLVALFAVIVKLIWLSKGRRPVGVEDSSSDSVELSAS